MNTALELMKVSGLQLQIGITQGPMRVGSYGGQTRKVFGALGDDVNLAARLMTTASAGEILLSGYVHKAVVNEFTFEPAFGLLDERRASRAKANLVADIEKRSWHLSTGFVGTKDLMLTLSGIGRNDVAYRLLLNETFPSWGFTIRQGATSIWERWDGWTPEKGFQNPEMNSFAHYAFGAVYQWIVENIGGIRSAGAGFRKIVIAPEPGERLTWAKTQYNSVNGTIRTEWRVSGGRLRLSVWIPAYTSAVVVLPRVGGSVTESGRPIRQQRQIRPLEGEGTRFEVGSGRYRFEYVPLSR